MTQDYTGSTGFFPSWTGPPPLPYSEDLSWAGMEIRNPDKTHLPQVLALLERCFPGRWTPDEVAGKVFFDEHYDPNHVWMAREKGQVLGFLHTVQAGETAWMKLLARLQITAAPPPSFCPFLSRTKSYSTEGRK